MKLTKSIFKAAIKHYGSQAKMQNALGIERRFMWSIKEGLYNPKSKWKRPMPEKHLKEIYRVLGLDTNCKVE